jgi:hypothetical protein
VRRRGAGSRGLLGLAVAALARPALACPGCITGGEDRIPAYLGTAILLSVLPLGLAAGIGLWLRRRVRAAEAANAGTAGAGTGSPPGEVPPAPRSSPS